jgi:hypothetical protein
MEFYVGSEFAEIRVEIDDTANGLRLKLTDMRNERVRHLDALELETLVWLSEERFEQLLDPSFDRWREEEGRA